MPLPGYTCFKIAADLFADLFPNRVNEIDGDDKEMVFIQAALIEAVECAEEGKRYVSRH